MDKFDETLGLSKLRHPVDSSLDNKTRDWSKQRVVIGYSTERNLLELNAYRALLKELGMHEIFTSALARCEQGFDAKPAADYLVHELGFKWQIRDADRNLAGTSDQNECP